VPGRSTVDCARDGRPTNVGQTNPERAQTADRHFGKSRGKRRSSADDPRPRVHARRDGGERPEQYMIMQLELAPAQPGTA
jgi:hypothetical protein